MSLTTELHWKEGLFIQPQHFQMMQRGIAEGFAQSHQVYLKYPYGIIDLNIQEYKLENEGMLEFSQLKVVLPSGIKIDILQNAILNTRSLKSIVLPDDKTVTIYLGIPTSNKNKNNTVIDGNINSMKNRMKRYLAVEEQHYDETNVANVQNIFVRKYNASLFFDTENMDGFEVLPLLMIKKKLSESKQWWTVDDNYIPPCLFVSGSDELKNMVNKTISNLKIQAAEFSAKLYEASGFESGSAKLQRGMMKLLTINSILAEIMLINHVKITTPLDIYTLLYKLTSSLCAIIPTPDFFSLVGYEHDKLKVSFDELINKLDELLNVPLIKDGYKKILFEKVDNNLYSASLNEHQMDLTQEFYICIKTKMEKDYLIKSVENGISFKVLPFEFIRGRAIPGLKLVYQHTPPEAFPQKPNCFYFYIKNYKDDIDFWKNILKNRHIGIFTTIIQKPEDECLELFFKK
jgi:type VI secretion system protein ImpJ